MSAPDLTTQEEDAKQLFFNFFGRDARPKDIVTVKQDEPECALVIGEVHAIQYKPRNNGDKLTSFHRFHKSNRPLLLVSSDGKQIYILKGGYRFTDRGFIG